MSNHIFENYLIEKTKRFDEYLAGFFSQGTHEDMERYLYGPLARFSENGGKRHRPLICMLACKAVGGDMSQAKSAAAAIEHFHTAALIHDDIADDSSIRRGMPCLHLQIGEGLAINAGDLALSLVTGTVLRDDNLQDSVKLRVLSELVDMTTRTIEGQALDIGWSRDARFDLSVDDYVVMATHKTAYYSGGVPLAVGAIIGGATEEQIEALRSYGMSAGLAFQLQDDLLNLIGEKETVGKDFRSDITEGKRTMIAVHALANASVYEREELLEILCTREFEPSRLERAVDIMKATGSIDFTREYALNLVSSKVDMIKDVLPSSPSRKVLLAMGDFFVSRLS